MQHYIGVKRIFAEPMTRLAYNEFRGWTLPAGENGADEGYLVEYIDGGAANTTAFKGYVSWSPKDVFERAYKPANGLTFGMALEALKAGERVTRGGWNGKGQWLFMIPESHWETTRGLEALSGRPWIGIRTVDDCFMPWVASQSDMLVQDWQIVV